MCASSNAPDRDPQMAAAVKKAEELLVPWLEATNQNPLLYDSTWGGLVIRNGKLCLTGHAICQITAEKMAMAGRRPLRPVCKLRQHLLQRPPLPGKWRVSPPPCQTAWGLLVVYSLCRRLQYGYFIYAAAVLAKLDPGRSNQRRGGGGNAADPSMGTGRLHVAFIKQYSSRISQIVKDIANHDETDEYFPYARHKVSRLVPLSVLVRCRGR
jgi:hypothetical protein